MINCWNRVVDLLATSNRWNRVIDLLATNNRWNRVIDLLATSNRWNRVSRATSRRVPTIAAIIETEQFFKLPVINRKEDPLRWWLDNRQVFPTIEKVAELYLCTVATSVPSERLFSKAGERYHQKGIGSNLKM